MITIIIPTYNASEYLESLLSKLESQTVRDYELIIIDSSSVDNTAEIARRHGADVEIISKAEFDHGGTRSMAAKRAKGEIVVFLTQDALPCDDYAIENIIKSFKEHSDIGASFGRQLPYPGASVFAEHLRGFNYPESSSIMTLGDRQIHGLKTIFLSNSFAAYRKDVLGKIGYFKSGLNFGEDACAGANILMAGYRIAYAADARVLHSHNYSIKQDFKRYFVMGTFHETEKWLIKEFGKAEGQGLKYIKSEIRFLLDKKKFYYFSAFFVRTLTKYLGYKLGVGYKRFPKLFSAEKSCGIPVVEPAVEKQLKIAFVCDWLTGMRGGERCLEAMCEIYPQADIFTLVHFPGSVSEIIESHKIRTSYIQKLPCNSENFRYYLPLFPNAIEKFDLTGYDCVLSFSHCAAKGIKVPLGIPHICYCYTPVRYAWHMRHAYLETLKQPKRKLTELILNRLRDWDRKISARVTDFIAISNNVQSRIKDAYGRDSVVIYPPVECNRFSFSEQDDGYYLILSALVPYKKVDLAVDAFNGTDKKLVVVGNGPELGRLKRMASSNITFVENASDPDVVSYFKRCTALLFPGEEDFGIVPLEAQACGKHVIAFGKGGALETVVGLGENNRPTGDSTGIFFAEQTPECLRKTIDLYEKVKDMFYRQKCCQNVRRFDLATYKKNMQNCIESVLDSYS